MSYLAPLNYDRFFRKIFKDEQIAKSFLEDFLNVKIESITKLDEISRLTDKSRIVEFDYRCKINGKYIIIDMQQWYKPDVVQRFYVYHTANTVLQLEDMKTKMIPIVSTDELKGSSQGKEIRDYRLLEPVLTLIWMVSDKLGFESDYVSYKLLPEAVSAFIENKTIWYKENVQALIEKREVLLTLLENNSKEINFLPKNKLIFMFQKNIVENFEIAKAKATIESKEETELTKYSRWFDFAQKTLKKDNSKKDFLEYKDDILFKEIMRRLDQSELTELDKQYINDQRLMWSKIGKYGKDFFDDGKKVGIEKGKIEGEKVGIEKGKIEGEKVGMIKGEKVGMIKGEKVGIEKGKMEEKLEIAKEMIKDGFSIDKIQRYTSLTKEEIQKLS